MQAQYSGLKGCSEAPPATQKAAASYRPWHLHPPSLALRCQDALQMPDLTAFDAGTMKGKWKDKWKGERRFATYLAASPVDWMGGIHCQDCDASSKFRGHMQQQNCN